VREEQGITADTALRLGKFFGTTPDLLRAATGSAGDRPRSEKGIETREAAA
jgi:hypothetical protein